MEEIIIAMLVGFVFGFMGGFLAYPLFESTKKKETKP